MPQEDRHLTRNPIFSPIIINSTAKANKTVSKHEKIPKLWNKAFHKIRKINFIF